MLEKILAKNMVQDEQIYNRSTISFEVLSEIKDKELIELLKPSVDYLFVFNF